MHSLILLCLMHLIAICEATEVTFKLGYYCFQLNIKLLNNYIDNFAISIYLGLSSCEFYHSEFYYSDSILCCPAVSHCYYAGLSLNQHWLNDCGSGSS